MLKKHLDWVLNLVCSNLGTEGKNEIFVFWPFGLQDLSPLTRDWTRATRVKMPSPNQRAARETPQMRLLMVNKYIQLSGNLGAAPARRQFTQTIRGSPPHPHPTCNEQPCSYLPSGAPIGLIKFQLLFCSAFNLYDVPVILFSLGYITCYIITLGFKRFYISIPVFRTAHLWRSFK